MKQDGAVAAVYEYDENGNRRRVTTAAGAVEASTDAQDRLVSYGEASFGYTPSGELSYKAVGADTTRYRYDALGNLLEVALPGGSRVEYIVDAENRRVGRKVDGRLVQGFLWEGALRPVAELDGAGAVTSRFVYGERPNVPEYMVKGGRTYRLVQDHLGSVRLVVDVATGEVAQRIDYDAYGQVVQDSRPGFQPFGYAGGLYDERTGLVRFGARDYDARAGRWMAKDLILFDGQDTNLYNYAQQDPVNFVDAWGTMASASELNSAQNTNAELEHAHATATRSVWPPHNGFLNGRWEDKLLRIGQRLDRYGLDRGRFLSPEGTSFGARALPADALQSPYNVFEVVKPLLARTGRAAPWFGQPGMGIQYEIVGLGAQYELFASVELALAEGYLIRLAQVAAVGL